MAALAACATLTERTLLREIQDSSVQATSTLGRVAVVAIDPDAATRKAWEDAFAARLSVRGVTTSTGDGLRGGMSLDAGAITVDGAPVIEAARKAGAEAILFIQPPRAVPIAPGGGASR
ncbi:MAG: hypothetical protein ABI585_07675, partial [Betaproteobacteria bacterium]